MKLSVSNIIWPKGADRFSEFAAAAALGSMAGVELALSCIWHEPVEASPPEIEWLRSCLNQHGLEISALHSLTFTRPELQIFGGSESLRALEDYVVRYAWLARTLGCKSVVFGSPSARKLNGKDPGQCDEIFTGFLEHIDPHFEGLSFNVEPLPADTCEYLNTFQEAVDLLKAAGKLRNVFVQLDVRACIENGETPLDVSRYLELVRHCQVSNPGLTIPGGALSPDHRAFASMLTANNYKGFVAAEVRAGPDPENEIMECMRSLRDLYG